VSVFGRFYCDLSGSKAGVVEDRWNGARHCRRSCFTIITIFWWFKQTRSLRESVRNSPVVSFGVVRWRLEVFLIMSWGLFVNDLLALLFVTAESISFVRDIFSKSWSRFFSYDLIATFFIYIVGSQISKIRKVVKPSSDAVKVVTNGYTSEHQRAPQNREDRHPTHKYLTRCFEWLRMK
jgi:hypothetical protein